AIEHLLLRRPAFGALRLSQQGGGVDRAAPCPEMLGAEPVARRLADVAVDILRAHRPPLAVPVEILEQLLARNVLRAAHDAGDATVDKLEFPFLARFAFEGKAQIGAG